MLRRLAQPTSANAYLLLLATMTFWSGNFVVGRWAAGHVPPVTLAALRWTGAAMLILPIALRPLRKDWPAIRANWPILVLLGLAGSAAFNTLQYIALTQTTATNAAIINSSGPVLIALACYLLLGDKVSARQAAGIATSLAGVLVVATKGSLAGLAGLAFNTGDLVMLVAMATWAIYTALLKKRPPMHFLSFAAVTYWVAALVNLPLAALEMAHGAHFDASAASAAAIAYTAVFPSLLAYLAYNRGVELIGGTRAGAMLHLVPLIAGSLAFVFLGEKPAVYHLLGFALILAGVWQAARAA